MAGCEASAAALGFSAGLDTALAAAVTGVVTTPQTYPVFVLAAEMAHRVGKAPGW